MYQKAKLTSTSSQEHHEFCCIILTVVSKNVVSEVIATIVFTNFLKATATAPSQVPSVLTPILALSILLDTSYTCNNWQLAIHSFNFEIKFDPSVLERGVIESK